MKMDYDIKTHLQQEQLSVITTQESQTRLLDKTPSLTTSDTRNISPIIKHIPIIFPLPRPLLRNTMMSQQLIICHIEVAMSCCIGRRVRDIDVRVEDYCDNDITILIRRPYIEIYYELDVVSTSWIRGLEDRKDIYYLCLKWFIRRDNTVIMN